MVDLWWLFFCPFLLIYIIYFFSKRTYSIYVIKPWPKVYISEMCFCWHMVLSALIILVQKLFPKQQNTRALKKSMEMASCSSKFKKKKKQNIKCHLKHSGSFSRIKHKFNIWPSNSSGSYLTKRNESPGKCIQIEIFIAALFIVVREQKQSNCLSTGE